MQHQSQKHSHKCQNNAINVYSWTNWVTKHSDYEIKSCLIVIRERNNWCTNTEDHRWMNFAMSVSTTVASLFQKFINSHGNHNSLLFHCVNVLNHTIGNQILPTTRTKMAKKQTSCRLRIKYLKDLILTSTW